VAPNLIAADKTSDELAEFKDSERSPLPQGVRNRPCRRLFRSSVSIPQTEKDSVAGRGEFELPVPISERPDDNMMSGVRRPDEASGSPEGQKPIGLYGQQHSKESFSSCAMNDIATDVAAAIKKGQAICPGRSQRP
jgi:hypothetical protein